MFEEFCDLYICCFIEFLNFIRDKIEFLYSDKANSIIALIATWFAFREWNSKRGHDLEVVYAISSISNQQPSITDLWVYNKKNKIEVITEINVMFGANCILHLKEFNDTAFILNPFERKKVNIEPISLYELSNTTVDMYKLFMNKKIKQTFYFTTPDGKVKAKKSKQSPNHIFIKDALHKGAFYYIFPKQFPIQDKILDWKVKYFGYCIVSQNEKYPFYIYCDGKIRIEYLKTKCKNIDLSKYDTIDKVKKFLLKQKIKQSKYTIEIFQRPYSLEEYYKLEDADITSIVFSHWKYFFIEPIVRWLQNRNLKKSNKNRKK